MGIIEQSWFGWGLAILIGFPLAAALLGELLGVVEKRKFSIVTSLWYTLNILLPVTAFFLIFRYVVGTGPENTGNRLLLTIALVLVIYVVVAIFNALFFGAAPTESWRARTPKLLRDIILGLMVVVGGGIVASQVWDQNVAGIFTALGVGSVILGFALQETLGNIMLGLSVLMERPFAEGDWVEIGSREGEVQEINWRAVRIRSRGGDMVVIPHSTVAKEVIINNSRPDSIDWVGIDVGFAYGFPPNRVKQMIRDVLASTDGALQEPAASILLDSYGDSSVNYKVWFAVAHPRLKFGVRDRVMTRIWYAAQRSGIEIPFPIRTVYTFDGKENTPNREREALSGLSSTTLFSGLSLDAAALDQWVRDAKLQHYSSGETVVEQGSQVPYLYVVVAGAAKLSCKLADHRIVELYQLERGDFFGETTLLSGADSPYSVAAHGDLEILSLAVADVRRLIESKPSLAIEVGQIMDIRRKAVAAAGNR